MFDSYKLRKKIEAFRKNDVQCKSYDKKNRIIVLTSGSRQVSLGLDLKEFDGKLQLAFSGDVITSDGEALSRVMKAMWNSELPDEFSANEDLRKQLFGDEQISEDTSDYEAETSEPQKPTPIYFRDMATYVTGQPNEVIVTVKASYRIDNK